jgi:hypothetical protein
VIYAMITDMDHYKSTMEAKVYNDGRMIGELELPLTGSRTIGERFHLVFEPMAEGQARL